MSRQTRDRGTGGDDARRKQQVVPTSVRDKQSIRPTKAAIARRPNVRRVGVGTSEHRSLDTRSTHLDLVRDNQSRELGANFVCPNGIEVDESNLGNSFRGANVLQVLEGIHVLPVLIVVPVKLESTHRKACSRFSHLPARRYPLRLTCSRSTRFDSILFCYKFRG